MKDSELARILGAVPGDALSDMRRLGVKMPSITISTRTNGKCRNTHSGMVVATMERTKAANLGINLDLVPEKDIDPAWRERELMWASVTHNARTPQGANWVASRLLSTGAGVAVNSVTANAGCTFFALGTTGQIATATTDKSISSATLGVSTNEFTTLGLTRVGTPTLTPAGTPGSNDGTISVAMLKAFTRTAGAASTVNGSAIFDQLVVAASNMWVADLFASALPTVDTDVINVTWTVTL